MGPNLVAPAAFLAAFLFLGFLLTFALRRLSLSGSWLRCVFGHMREMLLQFLTECEAARLAGAPGGWAGRPHLTITDRVPHFSRSLREVNQSSVSSRRRQPRTSRQSSVVSRQKHQTLEPQRTRRITEERRIPRRVAPRDDNGLGLRWPGGHCGSGRGASTSLGLRLVALSMTGLVVVSPSVVSRQQHQVPEPLRAQRNCGSLAALRLGMTTGWGCGGPAGIAGRVGVLRLRSACASLRSA